VEFLLLSAEHKRWTGLTADRRSLAVQAIIYLNFDPLHAVPAARREAQPDPAFSTIWRFLN
jgi:hypothetical protein